ncbi:MAG: hypothetical protein AAF846_22285 [Chloroflexota bacterium]
MAYNDYNEMGKLHTARALVRDGKYGQALQILEELDTPHARKMHAKILEKIRHADYDDEQSDEMFKRPQSLQSGAYNLQQASQPFVFNQTIQQVNNSSLNAKKGCFGDIPTVALIIIVLNMVFWGFLTVMTAAANSPEAGAQAFIGVTVFFLVSFILSYLYWKFYWWMLALSWTILTGFTLCAAIYGLQNLASF